MIFNDYNLNTILSLFSKKTIIPTEFHEQAKVIDDMLTSDTSGLIDSLTEFQVGCANTPVEIFTQSEKLNEILEEWLENLNSEFIGQGIKRGIQGLKEEYLRERWKGASFPLLKITKWDKIEGINLPISMMFVDGGSIFAKEKDTKTEVSLLGYDYFLGAEEEEKIDGKAFFLYKLFCRSFTKYPTPYLIRRGVYKNWLLMDMIKNKEFEVVNGLIPLIIQILKGSKELAIQQNLGYSEPELLEIKGKFQELMDKLNKTSFLGNGGDSSDKAPMRVSNFDEEIKNIIPDMEPMFKRELFVQAEKNILCGLNFIDVVEAVSTSRKESVLSPIPFIKECNVGSSDFNNIVSDLLYLIKEKNLGLIKYTAKSWEVKSKPIVEFMTNDFLDLIRSLADRGKISNETSDYICSKATVDYEIERKINLKELKQGDDWLMSPRSTMNTEKDTSPEEDFRREKAKTPKQTKEILPDRQPGTPEANNFNASKLNLIGSPYDTIESLPEGVRKTLDIEKQRKFMTIFNNAYKYASKQFEGNKQKIEVYAYRVAWSQVRKNHLEKSTLTVEKNLEEVLKLQDAEIQQKKLSLLDKLLGRGKE